MDKHLFTSKTFWLNLIVLLSALLPPVRDFLVQVGLSAEWVVSAQAALNVGLRLLTKKPVRLRGNGSS